MSKLNGNYLQVQHIPTGMIGVVVSVQKGTNNYWIQPERGPGLCDSKDQFVPLGREIVKNRTLQFPGPNRK